MRCKRLRFATHFFYLSKNKNLENLKSILANLDS